MEGAPPSPTTARLAAQRAAREWVAARRAAGETVAGPTGQPRQILSSNMNLLQPRVGGGEVEPWTM